MKIAVTGSNGLIGKSLVEELKKRRIDVIECNKNNCNILNFPKLKSQLKGVNIVIHCAAQLDENAKNLFEVNVKGTENVLEASAINQVEQFIFLSSVGVYGAIKEIKTEKTKPQPVTNYEKSKFLAEQKVLSYQEMFHTTILRPAIIIGKNEYWKKIIKLIKKGFPLIGNGKNKWQTVCDEDVVSAIIFCVNNENCLGETFIVAERNPISLKELVNFIRIESGLNGTVFCIPEFVGFFFAKINEFVNIVPMLNTAYVNRLLKERIYSTKKLEAIGWKAKFYAKDSIRKII